MPLSPEAMREQLSPTPKDAVEELEPLTRLELDCVDARGKRYKGTFIYKVPTLGEQVDIGRLKAQFLPNGAATDNSARLIVEMACYLEITLQKPRPEWWKPFDMYDVKPVTELYAEALKYERRFLGYGGDAGSNAQPSAGGPANAESVSVEAEDGAGLSPRAAAKRRTIASTHSEGSG